MTGIDNNPSIDLLLTTRYRFYRFLLCEEHNDSNNENKYSLNENKDSINEHNDSNNENEYSLN